jgi:protoheme IX farnesyltransferase
VLALAALVLFWTPIHFWALALVYRDDYARVRVPMLPVVTTPRRAALWGLAHGVADGLVGLALAFHPALGPIYFLPVLSVTLYLLSQGVRLVVRPSVSQAWRLFHASNLYLAVVLLAICADAVIHL